MVLPSSAFGLLHPISLQALLMPSLSSSPAAAAIASAPGPLNHNCQGFRTAQIFTRRYTPSEMLRAFTKINGLKVQKLGAGSSISKYWQLIAMQSSYSTLVDHVVLFKVKPGTPTEKSEAMVQGLRGLRELNGVLELTVAPVLSLWPAQISLAAGFTHALYSRHKDKPSLDSYMKSSEHVGVVQSKVLPITDGLLVVDWDASPSPPVDEAFGVIRIGVLKLKDKVREDITKGLLETFIGYPSKFPFVGQVSAGPNFSPAMANGFNYGYLCQFTSVKELEELTTNPNHVALVESKVNPHIDDFVVVDALK